MGIFWINCAQAVDELKGPLYPQAIHRNPAEFLLGINVLND